MKYWILSGLILFSSLYSEEQFPATSRLQDYEVSARSYTVVAAQTDGMSEEDTKQLAMSRAAQIAQNHGYSYFKVESEHEVGVFVGQPNYPTWEDFPGNENAEDVQEHGFDRDKVYQEDPQGSREYPGYQITIIFMESASPGTHKVCDFLKCKK